MLRVERVVVLAPDEALVVIAAPPLFLSDEEREQRDSVLARASTSIQGNSEALRRGLSVAFEDVEHLRAELGPDFLYLNKKLAEYGITKPELTATLLSALNSANCDPRTKKAIVAKWIAEFDYFRESLPQKNGKNSPQSSHTHQV